MGDTIATDALSALELVMRQCDALGIRELRVIFFGQDQQHRRTRNAILPTAQLIRLTTTSEAKEIFSAYLSIV